MKTNVTPIRAADAAPTILDLRAEAKRQACEHLARVGSMACASAVPEQTAVAAQQDAENALSMALHYLRTNAANVPGAMRKAVQALAALNTLQSIAPAGAGARGQQVQGV